MCSVIAVLLLALLGLSASSAVTVTAGEAEPAPVPVIVECRPGPANRMMSPCTDPSPPCHGKGRRSASPCPDGVILAGSGPLEPGGSVRGGYEPTGRCRIDSLTFVVEVVKAAEDPVAATNPCLGWSTTGPG